MNVDFTKWGPLTVLAVAVILVMVISGAVIAAVNPSTLSFSDYLDDITKVAAALGIGTGIGRGIHLGATVTARKK